jgi:hypothetical protein
MERYLRFPICLYDMHKDSFTFCAANWCSNSMTVGNLKSPVTSDGDNRKECWGHILNLCADNSIHFKTSSSEWGPMEVERQASTPPPQNFCESTLTEG